MTSKLAARCGASWSRLTAFLSIAALALVAAAVVVRGGGDDGNPAQDYEGSVSCKGCHEGFYDLWAPSHHGLAMQPFTPEFAQNEIGPLTDEIAIGDAYFGVEFRDGIGWVRERGTDGVKEYRIEHAMGGKNVYFFLTELERGRLQVLPLAYDVRRQEWYNTTASAVRHEADLDDEAIDWRDPELTFNTSCYTCHVSQLSTNYDLETDTYNTVWLEPGINCETCHGPGGEHVRACNEESCPEGTAIISNKDFTPQQISDLCAPCHAKMWPITQTFMPGDRYFDHYDLAAFEHPDFYPDGRDLGENFTYTLWLTSPCLASGELDCLDCHTSSGRYLFTGSQANDACLPCHAERVGNAPAHTHHAADSPGNECVACHMPTTEFARIRRSDHSMRPPTPSATTAFGSPNACNLCHDDEDAAWADRWVRQWHTTDHQAPILRRAQLVDDARKRQWGRLPEMLEYLESERRDAIFAAALIRLLEDSGDERLWPVLVRLLQNDPAPIVRGSAATSLGAYLTPEASAALLAATRDDYRVVRIRAAESLAAYPQELVPAAERRGLELAFDELLAALRSRPDDYFTHYGLGNLHLGRGELPQALAAFETALRLRPDFVPTLVNMAMTQAQLGETDAAEVTLRDALEIEPTNAAAHFNLGLLLLERGDARQAEEHLRAALETAPRFPAAAFNLCVLLAEDRLDEAIEWCRRAAELQPGDPRHAYTLAFYQNLGGDAPGAVRTLRGLIDRHPAYGDAFVLLGTVYEEMADTVAAIAAYSQALESGVLAEPDRRVIEARLLALQGR
ncbi:MAG: tetratricopeptide repeat protein [Gemmatimonadota bacterium]|nr:MAG: tetratricopeptide repeat protein [Gemmatimonadota bacterium]